MNIIKNIKIWGLSGLLTCGGTSCQEGLNGKKTIEISKKAALEAVDYKNLPVKEYQNLLEGEKKSVKPKLFKLDYNMQKVRYWDSIKTEALIKKAYNEGAQMVRDSITAENLKKLAAKNLKHIK